MSEQLSTPEDLIGQRFNKFVDEYASQALLWVIQKSSPKNLALPITHVELETHDYHRKKQEWAEEGYVMGVSVALSQARQLALGTNRDEGAIFIEGSPNFRLDFLDEDDNLPLLMREYDKDYNGSSLETITTLLDELEGLEALGVLIPGGERTFPDDPSYRVH